MFNKLKERIQKMPLGVKASMAYTICSILQRSLSLITMPLFTRLLTTEQYGQYSVYQSWTGILTIFITLNLAFGSFSKAMIKYEQDRQGYIAAIQNLGLVLAGIFFAFYLPFRQQWNALLELPTPLVCLMIAEILSGFALTCWYGAQRFDYKYKSVVAVTLAISVIAPVTAYLLVISSEQKGYARILGYAGVQILTGTVFFLYSCIRGKGGLKKEYWKYALTFNIPLIPYYLSQVIFNQSDRIMISHICGTDKAGLYGVAYNLGTILTFVLNAINNSYVPWFYGKIKDGKGEENRPIANGIAILMAFLLLAVIALAPEVILIMAGENYYEAAWVVPPVTMSLLLLFYSQLFINVEFYYEEKKMLVWGSIGAAVLNIVLNYLLIPVFGFVVAGYTTLASYVVFAASNYYTMRHICKKRGFSCRVYDMSSLLWILAVFSVLSFTALALYEQLVIRYSIITAVLLALVLWHKKTISFVKSILLRK